MERSPLRRTVMGAVLAAGLAGCVSTTPPSPPAAPPSPVVAAPQTAAVVEPAWMREPRDDADRALLARLLDPKDDVRTAAVAEWDTARMASWKLAEKEPQVEWPSRSAEERRGWEKDDDSTPVSPGHALHIAFENRTRALTRGLAAALREGDAPTRAAAAASMRAMSLPTGERLTEALADASPEVRVEAVKALSDLLRSEARYEACIPAMGKLLDDPDWRVRVAVCDGVTTSGFASEKLREIARTAMPRLIELASDEHAEVRRAALTAIGSIPSDVSDAELLPTFARALADDSPEVVAAAARWFGYEAEIGNLRPVPSPVVDSLRGLLASPHATVRWSAASAVWNTTHDSAGVVPVLAEQVAESRGVDLIDPLRLLQEIGPDAESAVPAILSVLTEGTFARKWGTGTEAMDALYAIGPPTATTLPLLETMLADATWAARREAAYAVATLDGDAAACEAVLARALSRERDPRVRGAIHRSRGAIGVGGDALVADLVRGLSTSDHEPWGETWGAIDGLRLMGPRAVAAMPALEPLVPFDENSNRPKAATALATIGGPSRAAEMLSRTKDNDDHVNGDVERIVEAVGPADAAIVPVLLRHIDESPFVIARALAEIGPAAKDALPALGRRMSGSSEEERVAAAEAVLRIGGDRDAALQVLVDAVDSTAALHESRSDEDLGTEAVYALGRSGDAARPAVAALRQSATRDGFEKQQAAAFALWRISGEVEPCVEAAIVAVLESYSSTPPTELVESLGAIGPSAAPATSALVGVALRCRDFSWDDQWKDSKVDVCRTTVRALGRIGPGAASALPTLRKLRRNALFRDAAEEAIRRIEAK